MELSEAKVIKEVFDASKVNSLLGRGWVILGIVPGLDGDGPYFMYVLGKESVTSNSSDRFDKKES